MTTAFKPFENNSQSVSIGELTFENQGDQVNLYGNCTFTIDSQSLTTARQLQQIMTQIVKYLEDNGAQNIQASQISEQQQQNVSEVENPFL